MEQSGAHSGSSNSSDPPEDMIQQRIVDIRKQLDDTYNIFVSAKEALSSISFEHLNEKMNETEMTSPEPEDVLVVDSNSKVDIVKSLEKLGTVTTKPNAKYEDIPELNRFFRVMSDLKEGIKKINMHQESISELNADIEYMESANKQALDEQLSKISLEEHQ